MPQEPGMLEDQIFSMPKQLMTYTLLLFQEYPLVERNALMDRRRSTNMERSEIRCESWINHEHDERRKLLQKFNRVELNDLDKELGLSKEANEPLASRLTL